MTPYYETELGKLYHGDCLSIMPELEPVDLVLTDPPYGMVACDWDTVIPIKPMWEKINSIRKENTAVVLTAAQPYTSFLVTSNVKLYKQSLVWLKTRPTNIFNAKKQFMKWHEDILIFYEKPPVFNPQMRTDGQFTSGKVQRNNHDRKTGIFGKTGEKKDYIHEPNNGLFYPKTIIEHSNVNSHKNVHPTQKPVFLMEYLINTYTNIGFMVLDFTIGSGTTAIACERLKRRWIGIEIEEKYCEIAAKRIEQERKQLKLF